MNVDEKTRNKKFFFVEFPGKTHDAMCATIIRTCRKIRNLYIYISIYLYKKSIALTCYLYRIGTLLNSTDYSSKKKSQNVTYQLFPFPIFEREYQ